MNFCAALASTQRNPAIPTMLTYRRRVKVGVDVRQVSYLLRFVAHVVLLSKVSKNNSISSVRRLPCTNCSSGEDSPGMAWEAKLLSRLRLYSSGLNITVKNVPSFGS